MILVAIDVLDIKLEKSSYHEKFRHQNIQYF